MVSNACSARYIVEEDGAHLFVKCEAAKEVWHLLGMENHIVRLEDATKVCSVLGTQHIVWDLP